MSSGLACSQYTECTDCTDNGKTSPNVCQFCSKADGRGGICQSLHLVDGNSSSGVRACAIDFDQRATSMVGCSARLRATTASGAVTSTRTTSTTTTTTSEVVVDIASVLTTANATLPGGVALDARVKAQDGAPVQALGDDGVCWLRAGVSLELEFGGRSISITRFEVGSWDATDSARLEFSNSLNRKRQLGSGSVEIVGEHQSLIESTRNGFTKYVLVAGANAEFSLKSFAFVDRTSAQQEPTDPPPALGTLEIALIAAFGALCVIIVVIVVLIAMRNRNAKNRANSYQMPEFETTRDDTAHPIDQPRRQSSYASITSVRANTTNSNYGPAPVTTGQSPTQYVDHAHLQQSSTRHYSTLEG